MAYTAIVISQSGDWIIETPVHGFSTAQEAENSANGVCPYTAGQLRLSEEPVIVTPTGQIVPVRDSLCIG